MEVTNVDELSEKQWQVLELGLGGLGGEDFTGGPYDLAVSANIRYKQCGYRIIATPS